jgi:hypothetical protein
MKKFMRRATAVAAIAMVFGIVAPSAAFAATNLPDPSSLRRNWISGQPTGTGLISMRDANNQIIGQYELFVDYWVSTTLPPKYNVSAMICVRDTLANGRGVIARLMAKYGSNSSKEIGLGKFKDSGGSCSQEQYLTWDYPVWAVDVDHGETWSGTAYQYTGHYNRYEALSVAPPNWPAFD